MPHFAHSHGGPSTVDDFLENLEFALSKAKGEWITHMGDDDSILKSRYDFIDKILNENKSIELVKTNWIKYYWHDYPIEEKSNTLLMKNKYSFKYHIKKSILYFKENINNPYIDSGNCWLIRNSLIDKIKKKYGYFCHPQNLEFFFIRSCLLESEYICDIDIPFAIAGSHGSSSSSIYNNKIHNNWEWDFEDSKVFKFSPIQKKTYLSISYDGLLRSLSVGDRKHLKKFINISRWVFFFINSDIGFNNDVKKIIYEMNFYEKIKLYLRVIKKKFTKAKKNHLNEYKVFKYYKSRNIFELSQRLDLEFKNKIF